MNTWKLLMTIGLLSALSAGAWANEPDGACREDAKRLCGDVKPGGGAIIDCMKSHESELSAGCKEKIADRKEHFEKKMADVKAACEADLKQYCANVTPGEGREMACLRAYEDKISATCKDKMPHFKRMEKRQQKADKK